MESPAHRIFTPQAYRDVVTGRITVDGGRGTRVNGSCGGKIEQDGSDGHGGRTMHGPHSRERIFGHGRQKVVFILRQTPAHTHENERESDNTDVVNTCARVLGVP